MNIHQEASLEAIAVIQASNNTIMTSKIMTTILLKQ